MRQNCITNSVCIKTILAFDTGKTERTDQMEVISRSSHIKSPTGNSYKPLLSKGSPSHASFHKHECREQCYNLAKGLEAAQFQASSKTTVNLGSVTCHLFLLFYSFDILEEYGIAIARELSDEYQFLYTHWRASLFCGCFL